MLASSLQTKLANTSQEDVYTFNLFWSSCPKVLGLLLNAICLFSSLFLSSRNHSVMMVIIFNILFLFYNDEMKIRKVPNTILSM